MTKKNNSKAETLAIDRLVTFIKTINVTKREFEHKIGVANGYIGNQFKNRGSIGSGVLRKILLVYPELNVMWLLTGHQLIIPRNKFNIIDSTKLNKDQLQAIA